MRARATLDMDSRYFANEGRRGRRGRAERRRTDYILLLFVSKVIHSCHSFPATAPPNVHSHHSGGAIQVMFFRRSQM